MKFLLTIFVVAAVAASPAMAQWAEQGDAGDLPASAQVPTGTGPLTSISGSYVAGASDVDMYCIQIVDPANFSAQLCGSTTVDTQLFLHRSNGLGVVCNDDNCGVQSWITNQLVASEPAGSYLIAVSGYNKDPISTGGLIFPNTFSGQNGPTGPGGGLPITGWSGTHSGTGTYVLALTGTSYCGATAVEPTTWGNIKNTYR